MIVHELHMGLEFGTKPGYSLDSLVYNDLNLWTLVKSSMTYELSIKHSHKKCRLAVAAKSATMKDYFPHFNLHYPI